MAPPGRITINTTKLISQAAKKRAAERFQSVSKYVEELVSRDLGLIGKGAFIVEEAQAPYGETSPKLKAQKN